MSQLKRVGRKPRSLKEQEERQSILHEVDQAALRAAPDAMRVLADAVSGVRKPDRESLAAAQTILDRVMGKAAPTQTVNPESEKMYAFLTGLTNVIRQQTEAPPLGPGDAPLVAEHPLPLRTDEIAVAGPHDPPS